MARLEIITKSRADTVCLRPKARALYYDGKFREARLIFERIVTLTEEAMDGPEHLPRLGDHPLETVATALYDLSDCCWQLGDYQAARGTAERALMIRQAEFGPQNPKVVASLVQTYSLPSLLSFSTMCSPLICYFPVRDHCDP
jgi:hypothetical protein